MRASIAIVVARIRALVAFRDEDGFARIRPRDDASPRQYGARKIACYMRRMKLDHLSDDALLAELMACCATGRDNDARILVFLMEIEERRIHLLRACSSMWDFCRRKLGLSGGQAFRRIAAARLAKRYPFILPLVERGVTRRQRACAHRGHRGQEP